MFKNNKCKHNQIELQIRKIDESGKTHYIRPKQKLSFCKLCNTFFINGKIPFLIPRVFIKYAFTFGKKRCSNCTKKSLVNLYYFDVESNQYKTLKSFILCEACDLVFSYEKKLHEFQNIYKNINVGPIKVGRSNRV